MAATVTFFVAAEVVQRVNGSIDDKTYRLLTQGVTCFLIAMSANTVNECFKEKKYEPLKIFILREPLGLLR